ncbi:MAG TPA: hypothetical protein VKA83_08380, partial [Methylomirabilota bacterium]|nr:hypothetical protein [Methylomirabilota bacterium]
PLAAGFAQSHWVTRLHFFDPTYLSWFDPANAELLHGEAIALTGRDIFSPLINLGWLSLALLAGWCVGSRYKRSPLALAGIAALVVTPASLTREPGEAMNDIAAVAALIASAAFLVAAPDSGPPAARLVRASEILCRRSLG